LTNEAFATASGRRLFTGGADPARLSQPNAQNQAPRLSCAALRVFHEVAGKVTDQKMPASIRVPAGQHAFLKGHAFGMQNHVCLPTVSVASGGAYVRFHAAGNSVRRRPQGAHDAILHSNGFETGLRTAVTKRSSTTANYYF
jgi:hypothetical protein